MLQGALEIALCLLISVWNVVGSIGNYLLCSVVYSDPTMQTPIHLILVNLALADLIGCLVIPPLTLALLLCNCQEEVFSTLGNIHLVLSGALAVLVSAINVLLSIDRYDAIIRHLNRRITKEKMKGIAIGLWAMDLAIAGLVITLVSTSTFRWIPLSAAPNLDDEKLYVRMMIAFIAGCVILLGMVLAVTYSFVSVKCTIRQHKQQLIQLLGQENLNKEEKLTRMSLWVALVFAVTSLPSMMLGIHYTVVGPVNYNLEKVTYAMLAIGYGINPVVYTQFMPGLWRAMKRKMKSFFGCQDPQVHPAMQMNTGP